MRTAVLGVLAACAGQTAGTGPTFGGAGREARVLAEHPVDLRWRPCAGPLCLTAQTAWLRSGELLVAVGVEGEGPPPQPVDVVFVLDDSGSVSGSTDVRDAAAELGLDALQEGDTAAVVAFRSEGHVLLPPTPLPEARREAEAALRALDGLPGVQATFAELGLDPCAEPVEDVLLAAEDLADPAWDALWEAPDPVAVLALACDTGTDVAAGFGTGRVLVPPGSPERASRVVLVSDLDGADEAQGLVEAAADAWIGTTLLAITSAADLAAGEALAQAPGGLLLDGEDPADALGVWAARGRSLLVPTSWGLELTLADDAGWRLVRAVGPTDAAGDGVNATFASQDHGVFGVLLRPTTDDPAMPELRVAQRGPVARRGVLQAPLPGGVVSAGGHRADHLGVLHVALALDLVVGPDPDAEQALAEVDRQIRAAREGDDP